MLKCTVVGCANTCYTQCAWRISPQRAEAIKNLGIVHSTPVGKCITCGKDYIHARRNGKDIVICACRID